MSPFLFAKFSGCIMEVNYMVKATVNEYKNSDIPVYTDSWIERYKTVDQLFERLTENKEVHDVTQLDENHLVFGFYKLCNNEKIYTQYELIGV